MRHFEILLKFLCLGGALALKTFLIMTLCKSLLIGKPFCHPISILELSHLFSFVCLNFSLVSHIYIYRYLDIGGGGASCLFATSWNIWLEKIVRKIGVSWCFPLSCEDSLFQLILGPNLTPLLVFWHEKNQRIFNGEKLCTKNLWDLIKRHSSSWCLLWKVFCNYDLLQIHANWKVFL